MSADMHKTNLCHTSLFSSSLIDLCHDLLFSVCALRPDVGMQFNANPRWLFCVNGWVGRFVGQRVAAVVVKAVSIVLQLHQK